MSETQPAEDIRIIRVSELSQIQRALTEATNALMTGNRTDEQKAVLVEMNVVQHLVSSIQNDPNRQPPGEIAGQLETQTRIL